MIIFIEREVLPDREALKQQFTFLTPEDIDSIYIWMQEKRELCIQNGNNSISFTIQQVYKYSSVVITNDYLSEFRTWAYVYTADIFTEEYKQPHRTIIVYEKKNQINKTKKNEKILLS